MKLSNYPACNNEDTIHVPVICGENADAFRVWCRQCNNEWRVGKNHNGGPQKDLWGELFFEDAVQPPHPLFYKLHAEHLSTL